MILYVCPRCGTWQDVGFAEAIRTAFAPLTRLAETLRIAQQEGVEPPSIEPVPPNYQCPAGCGTMEQVHTHDKLIRISSDAQLTITHFRRSDQETHDEEI